MYARFDFIYILTGPKLPLKSRLVGNAHMLDNIRTHLHINLIFPVTWMSCVVSSAAHGTLLDPFRRVSRSLRTRDILDARALWGTGHLMGRRSHRFHPGR